MFELEMFFFGFPRIVGMKHFPRLTKLCIVNQKITSMKGIESCKSLQELWICEGQLTKIEGTQVLTTRSLGLVSCRTPRLYTVAQALPV